MPTLRQMSLDARLRLARRAAQAAGTVQLAYFGPMVQTQTKSSEIDLVTHVDLECDELIREILSAECPEDLIITEETFQEGQEIDTRRCWIVDPLDGTTNYAHGFPHFAVSIAYVEEGETKAGVIFDPFKNEMFTGVKGGEVMKNGVPIHVTQTEPLSKALLATGFPYDLSMRDNSDNNIDLHNDFLKRCHGVRRPGAAALDLAYVACGRLDGFWEFHLSPWDVAAGILLVEQAGGQISDFHGEPVNLAHRRVNIVGSNGRLQNDIVDVTRVVGR